MWYIAEPFSPSSWRERARPDQPIGVALVDGHRQRLVAERPELEEAVDLVGAHRARPGSARAARPRGRSTSAGTRATFSGTCFRSTTRSPSSHSGNHAALPMKARYTIARMRRWSELAERVASTTRTSEKTSLLADYLRTLDEAELPIAVVFLTGRPFPEADQRATGIGWATIANAVGEGRGHEPGRPRRGVRPLLRHQRGGRRRARERRARAGRGGVAGPRRRRGDVRRDRVRVGPGSQGRAARRRSSRGPTRRPRAGSSASSSGELRIGLREGLVEAALAKAFDRPLDAVKRAGHAHRRHRAQRRVSLARAASTAPSWRSSIRSSSCSPRRPRTPPRSSSASGRPSGSRTSTTASAASSTARATTVRLYSRDLHDISSGYPGGRRRRRADLPVGRHPRRRAPRLAGRHGAAVHRAPDAARPQGPIRGAPRRGARDLRRLGRPRARPARARRRGGRSRRRRRADAGAAADRAPAAARGARPPARRRRRRLRALAPDPGGFDRRARGRLRGGPGAPQRGPHGQGPDLDLLARAGAATAG